MVFQEFQKTIFLRLFCALVFVLGITFFSKSIGAEVIFLVNKKNETKEMSTFFLKGVMIGRVLTWDDGTPIRVISYKNKTPEFIEFCSYISVYPVSFRRLWDESIYTGGSSGPIYVDNKQQMLKKITEVSGAIGYVSGDNFGDDNMGNNKMKEQVNVLQIK